MSGREFTTRRGGPLLTRREWSGWIGPLAVLVFVAPFLGTTGPWPARWSDATGVWVGLMAIRVGWRWIAFRSRKEWPR